MTTGLSSQSFTLIKFPLHIVGGGGCLIRNFWEYDRNRVTINTDICATAKGYEYLAEIRLKKAGLL